MYSNNFRSGFAFGDRPRSSRSSDSDGTSNRHSPRSTPLRHPAQSSYTRSMRNHSDHLHESYRPESRLELSGGCSTSFQTKSIQSGHSQGTDRGVGRHMNNSNLTDNRNSTLPAQSRIRRGAVDMGRPNHSLLDDEDLMFPMDEHPPYNVGGRQHMPAFYGRRGPGAFAIYDPETGESNDAGPYAHRGPVCNGYGRDSPLGYLGRRERDGRGINSLRDMRGLREALGESDDDETRDVYIARPRDRGSRLDPNRRYGRTW